MVGLGKTLLETMAFAGLAIALFVLAFWLMHKLSPFSIHKEIEEDQNVALAILMGSVILGLALIVAAAFHGA